MVVHLDAHDQRAGHAAGARRRRQRQPRRDERASHRRAGRPWAAPARLRARAEARRAPAAAAAILVAPSCKVRVGSVSHARAGSASASPAVRRRDPAARGSRSSATAAPSRRRSGAPSPPARPARSRSRSRALRTGGFCAGGRSAWSRSRPSPTTTDPNLATAHGAEALSSPGPLMTRPWIGEAVFSYPPFRRAVLVVLLTVAALSVWSPAAHAQLASGPGGPILVVVTPDAPFGGYYAEILRAEGLNEFAVADANVLTPGTLAGYQVVLLAGTEVSGAQTAALSGWVQGGGNLIAMRPDARLAGLLGLGSDTGDLGEGYLRVDTARAGITGATMQFHGTADLWSGGGRASGRDALRRRLDSDVESGGDAPGCRGVRGPGRGVRLRPRPVRRLHAPGQPGLGRREARRAGWADPLGRPLLPGLGEPRQGPDPPGRRAAAAAGKSHHADEPRPGATAAVLVSPAG